MPVRLLVEPRERNTLLGNLALSSWLRKTILDWRAGILPQPDHRAMKHAPEIQEDDLAH
jgi:hypothetical protein